MLIRSRRLPRSSIITRLVSRPKKGSSFRDTMSKKPVSKRFALEEGAAVLVALGLDLLGEPPARWHPVVWYGKLIQHLEQVAPRDHFSQLLYGGAMLMMAAPTAILPIVVVHQLAKRVRAAATQAGRTSTGLI